MSQRKSDNSLKNITQGGYSTFNDIRPPCLPGTTSIDKLPIELWERIFEFVGDIAYVSGRDRVDFPDDETPYPYVPRDTHLEVPCRTEPTPYDYLRSSSLASRAFTVPAQRALFRVSKTRSSIGMLRLLRSLLEYPANRKYVQWLVTSPLLRENNYDCQNPPDILDPISALVRTLGPLLRTPVLDQLQNVEFFGRLLQLYIPRDPKSFSGYTAETKIPDTDDLRSFYPILGDQTLRAILELCPQIRGVRLFHRNTFIHWGSLPLAPEAFLCLPNGLLGQDCFRLKSLTLDLGALYWSLLGLREKVPEYPSGCPPTVEYLKIVGKNSYISGTPLDDFYEWLSTNKKLRELRMLQGADCHPWPGAKKQNWNTIITMFKDTLEVLIMDGNRYHEGTYHDGVRFGPSGVLSTLQCKKLAYLKVPLHYLRDDTPKHEPVDVDWEDLELAVQPDGSAMDIDDLFQVDEEHEDDGQESDGEENNESDNPPSRYNRLRGIRILQPGDEHNILGLIQTEFPPSLRKLEVVVVEPSMEEDKDYAWRTIGVPI
ncbi:hypothetical protein GE21DRAFT_8430 [Neurospora crassa]|uniref:Uncharacterized protein n=1 Tax=Neurospora crassa (strain ATCC 24698 / 74-OR23-1A / CBS 708.71 / DSM 1257 / FGSC 987) TaxID=367110 RepID=Q7RW56_NEUCR|nr:hypothetical protein NCU07249 [Neurospora crassa OR74A]EAA26588.1 hypothetical protein NCU07249 [Neurospora crassa OR74A]KHE78473.1 hypothetical protein GE21DRAFT_8430 [Neurospora crassa]|eukprot:XP_955824.1 hypothetical protein NCU07249 [Neurospora crassa OR74A]